MYIYIYIDNMLSSNYIDLLSVSLCLATPCLLPATEWNAAADADVLAYARGPQAGTCEGVKQIHVRLYWRGNPGLFDNSSVFSPVKPPPM